MTRYSIALVQVQVLDIKTATPLHVANFGQQGLDLLDVWCKFLQGLQGSGGYTTMDRHLIPEQVASHPRLRQVKSELDYGHHGLDRRVRDAKSGAQTGLVGSGEVAADPLRSLMRVPTNGTYALFAIEVVGRASAAGMITNAFKAYVQGLRVGCRVSTSNVEEVNAWEEYLRGAELKEVEFLYLRRAENNRAGRPVVEKYGVRAERGQMLPSEWIPRLRQRRMGAGDVLSTTVPDGAADETVLVVEGEGQRRTLRIGGGLPRFTWQVGDDDQRPLDDVFYSMAEDIVTEELARLLADPAES